MKLMEMESFISVTTAEHSPKIIF